MVVLYWSWLRIVVSFSTSGAAISISSATPWKTMNSAAVVEILEIREHGLDPVADPIVIGDQVQPRNFAVWQSGVGHAGENCRFGSQLLGGRPQLAARSVHHRHRILDRDGLRTRRLHVLFR